jgi:hypothetical protein
MMSYNLETPFIIAMFVADLNFGVLYTIIEIIEQPIGELLCL